MTPLLEVSDLHTHFTSFGGKRVIKAVDGISFTVNEGETLGLVGESGCGKTTTCLSIVGLLPNSARIAGGRIAFQGEDLTLKNSREMRRIRGRMIAMILQDPMASLNPLFSIYRQVAEPAYYHRSMRGRTLRTRVQDLLRSVRIPSPDDVRGHYVVRESLETQAARLFSEKASKGERVSLQELGARVDRMSQEPDRKRYLRVHYEFHRSIAEGARCPVLSAAIEQTCALSSTWFCVFPRPVAVGVPRRHRDLAKALATGTSAVAAAAMRKHVRSSRQEALHRLQPYFEICRSTGRTFSRSAQRIVS